MLKDLDITGIISLADTEPDFIEVFGETEDQVSYWSHEAKYRIQDLMIRAYKEVSDRKASTQTGFKKLNYPQFNRDVLNYLELKKQCRSKQMGSISLTNYKMIQESQTQLDPVGSTVRYEMVKLCTGSVLQCRTLYGSRCW